MAWFLDPMAGATLKTVLDRHGKPVVAFLRPDAASARWRWNALRAGFAQELTGGGGVNYKKNVVNALFGRLQAILNGRMHCGLPFCISGIAGAAIQSGCSNSLCFLSISETQKEYCQ
ncbi:MAG: hypothetical protein IIT98_01695 [Kiritimatiellae bacterium]|nr:hypothetical protein [Kiritimatiellia bacterium]